MTMDKILRAVASTYDVRQGIIIGKRQDVYATRPRQVAMWIIRDRLKHSFPMIGLYFGRDHTSVMAACKRIDELFPVDAELRAKIETINAALVPVSERPEPKRDRERALRRMRALLDGMDGMLASLERDEAESGKGAA
jgi:hypothetical protein